MKFTLGFAMATLAAIMIFQVASFGNKMVVIPVEAMESPAWLVCNLAEKDPVCEIQPW